MPTLALDSMPLTRDPLQCRDHSGLQVFDLTTVPLVAPSPFAETRAPPLMAARAREVSADGRRHRLVVRDTLRWSDGAQFVAGQVKQAIESVRASPASPATFWLRDLQRIEIDGDSIRLETSRPQYRFSNLTSLLGLRPISPDGVRSLGPYAVTEWEAERISLSPNRHWPHASPADPLSCVRVKEPEDNWDGFHRGELDLTADTAFPYARLHEAWSSPYLRILQPGVFMVLGLEGRLAGEDALALRRRIREAVNAEAICTDTGGVLLPKRDLLPTPDLRAALERGLQGGRLRVPEEEETSRSAGTLRFAYDPYFPNAEVARLVASQLRASGIDVALCEDSFEHPHQRADLRLCLLRALRPGELGMYHGLLFSPLLRTDRVALRRYLACFDELDRRPEVTTEEVAAVAGELQTLLDRRGVVVPIAEVPGLCLSRLSDTPFMPC